MPLPVWRFPSEAEANGSGKFKYSRDLVPCEKWRALDETLKNRKRSPRARGHTREAGEKSRAIMVITTGSSEAHGNYAQS